MNNLDNQDILSGMDRFIDDIKQSNSAKAKSDAIEALKRTNVIKENGEPNLSIVEFTHLGS